MSLATQSRRRLFDTLLLSGFVLALAAPSIDALVRSDEARGPAPEQRVAEPLPPLPHGVWTLAPFPPAYERHFNDTLGLRDRLLRWHSIVQMLGFGISSAPSMVVGQDRWLFLTEDKSIPVYRGLEPLTDSEISGWLARWEQRRDYLAQRGIGYLFVIAPNKETIYPERMPKRFNKVGPTRLDQIAARLATRPDLPVLDLRNALAAEKRSDAGDDFTYYPLGTHWNGRGHYAAYRAIAEALQPKFPHIVPSALDALERFDFTNNGDSWASRMYIGDLLPQSSIAYYHPQRAGAHPQPSSGLGMHQLRVYASDRSDLPRGALFHDSFGDNTASLLSASFQSLACLQTPRFDVDFIERTRPDVVIELFVERVLVTWPAQEVIEPQGSDRACFQNSTRELFHLDLASAPKTLREWGSTRIDFDADPESPRVVVRHTDGDGRFFLPRIEPLDGSDVLVRIEIESPSPAWVGIYFRSPGEERYDFEHYRWALLARGSNEVHARFATSEMEAPLHVRLVGPSTNYELRALDARAAEPRR